MPDPEETMGIILTGQMELAAVQTTLDIRQLIQSMRASGATDEVILALLLADLNEGGRIFGTFRNAVKSTTKNGVEFASHAGSRAVFETADVREFIWISVGDKNVCSDCADRHREINTMEAWEIVGTPKSGFSICQINCRCHLIPSSYSGENLDQPLIREAK